METNRFNNLIGWCNVKVTRLLDDKTGIGSEILGGIMLMIIGFATLVLGNFIFFSIAESLPTINDTGYNLTYSAILGYANTVFPLFGLVLMVLGFAIILYTLRSSQRER